MPGFDRTGPLGRGPMTGGGFGRCGRTQLATGREGEEQFYGRFGAGRGRGFWCRGMGPRWGRGGGYAGSRYPYRQDRPGTRDWDLEALRHEVDDVKAYLKDLEATISQREKKGVD